MELEMKMLNNRLELDRLQESNDLLEKENAKRQSIIDEYEECLLQMGETLKLSTEDIKPPLSYRWKTLWRILRGR